MVKLYFKYFILLIIFTQTLYTTLLFTGDIDLRYHNIDFRKSEFELHIMSVSLRKIFADKRGDRIILFLLVEAMHNFKENMIDQGYFQYKGPLGKWNITFGRYRLPYGLLPNYSTDRLLISTIEDETIGFPADNGIQFSGILKDFDYAISLSQGVGQVFKSIDINNQGLIIFRVGYQEVDFEDWRIGVSGLIGRIKKMLGVDIIKYSGPLVLRNEFSLGEENSKKLLGIYSNIDYALFPKIDINTGYTLVKIAENKRQHTLIVGLTYNIFSGFQMRIAHKFPIKLEGGKNDLSIQAYYIFNRNF